MTDTTPKPCPLLVLFHAIERERANGRHAVADELQAAHDAMAELVRAGAELAAAQQHYDALDCPGGRRWDRLQFAREAHDAALARFTLPA